MLSQWWLFLFLIVLFAAVLALYVFAMRGKSAAVKWGGFAGIAVFLLLVGGITLYANRAYQLRQAASSVSADDDFDITTTTLKIAVSNFLKANDKIANEQKCGMSTETNFANCMDTVSNIGDDTVRSKAIDKCANHTKTQHANLCEQVALTNCQSMLNKENNPANLNAFRNTRLAISARLGICLDAARRLQQELM
jgi:hypothetical protein